MQRRIRISPATLTAIGLTLALACQGDKKRDENGNAPLPDKPVNEEPIQTQSSEVGILEVRAELTDAGLLIHIANTPAGATLECDLDDKPILPCHDGALFAKPTAGDHKITAVAMLDGKVAALGESAAFTILPEQISSAGPDGPDPLAVTLTKAGFLPGMTLTQAKEFAFEFALAGEPDCKAELYCKYGGDNSEFWAVCSDDGALQFKVDEGLMAMGRQKLSVQARCPDKAGPTLELHWYGVADGYEPLMLRSVADPRGQTFVYLMKADDCPLSQLSFECGEPDGQDDWALCPINNVLDKPAPGTRVRASCDGRKGPVLTLTAP